MIDCGTSSLGNNVDETSDKKVKEQARKKFISELQTEIFKSPQFLLNNKRIDILIVTHEDKDHHNKFKEVFKGKDIEVTMALHSGSHTSPCSRAWIESVIKPEDGTITPGWNFRYVVTLNQSEQTISIKNPQSNDPNEIKLKEGDGILELNKKKGKALRILEEKNCSIHILASNVKTCSDKNIDDQSNDQNRGSIVTLIEVYGEKIIVCGDATKITEKFLIDTYDTLLEKLTILQIGHHGSAHTSSSTDFVKKTTPNYAYASCGYDIRKHKHPHKKVLDSYESVITSKRTDNKKHDIGCWKEGGMNSFSFEDKKDIEHLLFTTGSSNTTLVYHKKQPTNN
jgi:beta-lactamase superfamily II metal-dependent hydrolase